MHLTRASKSKIGVGDLFWAGVFVMLTSFPLNDLILLNGLSL